MKLDKALIILGANVSGGISVSWECSNGNHALLALIWLAGAALVCTGWVME